MFVMQAVIPPVTQNPKILLILGMPWYVLVLIAIVFILMGLILVILALQRAKQKANRDKAIGHILLEVLPATGGNIPIEWELCQFHIDEARVFNDSSRGTFSSPHWIDAPKGHDIGAYVMPDEFDYATGWPIGAKPWEQVTIPCYIVHKNQPWPIGPHTGSNWDDNKIMQRSSAMFAQAKNESTMQALMSPQMAFAEQLRLLVEKMKWLIIAAICAGAAAVLSLANVGISWFYVGGEILGR
jgi:hypothetical protein